ncbi:MAG: phenylalanine--tRNA ligase subunit beta, partial [Anaerolineae bacterium]|nr:phenylalanine--tRNA ligase subunit beta [Anaerolineae bacterium]
LLGGGTIARGMVDAYPVPPTSTVILLTAREVERILGIPIAAGEAVSILESLEFKCEPIADGELRVTVPPHRLDCQYPADLIEEIARIYGYDRIPAVEIADRLPPQRSNRALDLEEQVRDVLVGCGLQEIVAYSLTSPDREAALVPGLAASDLPLETFVVLANPINPERTVMRHSLLPNALQTAAANLRNRDRIAIFEVGKVFCLEPGAELPAEPRRLAIVMAGQRGERHWRGAEPAELDFFDLKGVVETLLGRLHLIGAAYEPADHPTYQPGRTARLAVGGVGIGFIGELHPAVRQAFDLPGCPVTIADLDLEALLAQVPPAWFVEPISPYPAVLQDLAVVVDEAVPAAAVQDLIAGTGGFLLKDVRLFDLYRGAPIPQGKKSLAYALTFQSPDRTLSDALVAKQVERIVQRLKKELGAGLRA